tara:strand:+ start:489 stop:956 length:468 start_codon:yes stop_codon:yes gene_type:complete
MYGTFLLFKSAKNKDHGFSLKVDEDNNIRLQLLDEQFSIEPSISRIALGKLEEWFTVCSELYPALCKGMHSASEHRFQTSSNSFSIEMKLTHQPYADENKHIVRIKIGQCVFETSYAGEVVIKEALDKVKSAIEAYSLNKQESSNKSSEVQDSLF